MTFVFLEIQFDILTNSAAISFGGSLIFKNNYFSSFLIYAFNTFNGVPDCALYFLDSLLFQNNTAFPYGFLFGPRFIYCALNSSSGTCRGIFFLGTLTFISNNVSCFPYYFD